MHRHYKTEPSDVTTALPLAFTYLATRQQNDTFGQPVELVKVSNILEVLSFSTFYFMSLLSLLFPEFVFVRDANPNPLAEREREMGNGSL